MITEYIQHKGYIYEDYVLKSLMDEYDNVYKFKDTPEYIISKTSLYENYDIYNKYRNCDIGVDLVAIKDDKVYFIQCKNYDNIISINDLSSFYFLIYEYELNGIVIYNGVLSERLIDLKKNRIKYINLPYNNTIVDINFYNEIKEKIKPRDYQIEIYNEFKKIKRGVISLPCGMGKTYTAWMIGSDYKNIIIISPLKCLADTNIINMYKYSENTYNPILISSDTSRDIKKIKGLIKEKNIISTTYDSVDILNKILEIIENYIIIVDEYHNLSDKNLSNSEDEINKLLKRDEKIIYLSATPKKDNKLFGEYIYKYGWLNAIKNKYICDFKIILPEENEEKNEIFEKFVNQLEYTAEELKIIKKVYYYLEGIKYYGNKKSIIYLTNTEKIEQFGKIIKIMSELMKINIEINIIDYKTAKTKRREYIKNFKESSINQILLNVQILNEGIDIPECDSVYITEPMENIINLIQRMCRCNRIIKNKNTCNIYIWSNNKTVKKIENYLNEVDIVFENKIEYLKTNIKKNMTNIKNKEKTENKLENKKDNKTENNKMDFINYIRNNKEIKISDYEIFNNLVNKSDFIINMEKSNEFLIDSEILRDWLKINIRRKFNDTIKRSYIRDIDYKIEKIKKSKGSGGHNLEIITLTPEAAKKICLSTRSKIGRVVQQYFIDIELALHKYKNYIIEAMNKKIEELENKF
jgi:superfamily II DNA or RNA helicase